MNEFFMAAFPWIAIAIAIAILATHHASETKKNKQSKENREDKAQGNRLTEGMCIGMCAGVVLGTSGVCDLGTGVCLGMLLGEVIGLCIKK